MKKNLIAFLLLLLAGSSYCQNIHEDVKREIECDSLFWTSTEYPVRLENDISELQKIISNQLTVYPKDMEKHVKFTYQFTITCNGINTKSHVKSYEGPQSLGLSKRILKILDANCIWSPAMVSESPVNAYYDLSIDFKRGEILVIPQNNK